MKFEMGGLLEKANLGREAKDLFGEIELEKLKFWEMHKKRVGFELADNFEAKGNLKIQILRSCSNWSVGNVTPEKSIYIAYLELIMKSKYFIYIENQFFVSSTAEFGVKNQIANALLKRIVHAIKTRQKFKVVIMIPALPAFEDKLAQKEGIMMQIQIGLQNLTIRNLMAQVKRYTETPEDYILFCSLRTHTCVKDKPVTEIVYIHSKVVFLSFFR